MKRTVKMTVADFMTRVDELRRWRRMSEEDLAQKAGIPYRKFMKFKTDGERARISMDHVWNFSVALKVSPVALFTAPKSVSSTKGKKKSRAKKTPRPSASAD